MAFILCSKTFELWYVKMAVLLHHINYNYKCDLLCSYNMSLSHGHSVKYALLR